MSMCHHVYVSLCLCVSLILCCPHVYVSPCLCAVWSHAVLMTMCPCPCASPHFLCSLQSKTSSPSRNDIKINPPLSAYSFSSFFSFFIDAREMWLRTLTLNQTNCTVYTHRRRHGDTQVWCSARCRHTKLKIWVSKWCSRWRHRKWSFTMLISLHLAEALCLAASFVVNICSSLTAKRKRSDIFKKTTTKYDVPSHVCTITSFYVLFKITLSFVPLSCGMCFVLSSKGLLILWLAKFD